MIYKSFVSILKTLSCKCYLFLHFYVGFKIVVKNGLSCLLQNTFYESFVTYYWIFVCWVGIPAKSMEAKFLLDIYL